MFLCLMLAYLACIILINWMSVCLLLRTDLGPIYLLFSRLLQVAVTVPVYSILCGCGVFCVWAC